MTTTDPTHGSIVHVELYSENPDATQASYERAFNWSFESVEGMEYTLWHASNPPGGGLLAREDGEFGPPSTLIYLGVDDLASTRAAIESAGGEILEPEMEIPEMGVFALFRDPGGVVEAAWEDRSDEERGRSQSTAFTDDPAPGSIVHFELYSEDPPASSAFHEEVFGWEIEGIADGNYTFVRPPSPPFGGVMAASESMSVGVLLYVLVDDAAATIASLESTGATVLRDPFVVEGWGTMGVVDVPGEIVQAIWEPIADESGGDGLEPDSAA